MAEGYPQHARLDPHVPTNWEIRHFLEYLESKGVFMARAGNGRTVHVPREYVEWLLLEWRGIDVPAYEAEARTLNRLYGLEAILEDLGGLALRRKKPTWSPGKPGQGEIVPIVRASPAEIKDDGLAALMARVRGKFHGEDDRAGSEGSIVAGQGPELCPEVSAQARQAP